MTTTVATPAKPTNYDPQFGFTPDGRRVHMGWGFNGVKDAHSHLKIVDVVAWSKADDGREGVLAALLSADLPERRLCRRCFAKMTRVAYVEMRKAAGGAK